MEITKQQLADLGEKTNNVFMGASALNDGNGFRQDYIAAGRTAVAMSAALLCAPAALREVIQAFEDYRRDLEGVVAHFPSFTAGYQRALSNRRHASGVDPAFALLREKYTTSYLSDTRIEDIINFVDQARAGGK